MTQAQLHFSTEILRRLGEELNPNPDQGIIELVKNSYDADARQCTIELLETDKPGGTVRIRDDGEGMDAEAIQNGWLVLGSSIKSPSHRTRLGRIPAGNKGLGRLAALRMGTKVQMKTRPQENPEHQSEMLINWSEFDKARLVDDVQLEIIHSKPTLTVEHGTEITISDLRTSLGRADVKRLARALLLLADPFKEARGSFNPILKAPEFEDLERLVRNRYFGEADLHLIARLDIRGHGRAEATDWQGNMIFSGNTMEFMKQAGRERYDSPPAVFDLWIFLLDADFSMRHTVSKREVQSWLDTFGGVHLYQNDLRVNPYGNPGNDWLDMNLQRARSPELRPSTNTVIGRVAITDTSELLTQKTDRSGFIENQSFLELRLFAQDALNWLARKRLEEREKRRTQERTETPKQSAKAQISLKEAIQHAPQSARLQLEQAFVKYDRAREKEVNALHREVQLYRTLSSAGITAATFAHESAGNALKAITLAIRTIRQWGITRLGSDYTTTLESPVDTISRSTQALGVLGSVTLSMIDHEKRRIARVDLHPTIKGIIDLFKPFLDEREVTVDLDFDTGNPYLRGSKAAIESIFVNLLNNSINWFEAARTQERKIIIRTRRLPDSLMIRILDSGPGIVGIDKEDIWLPGETTRQNGTGLGLTIVRDTVADLGGNVDAQERSEIGGAEIIIELPILGA